MKYIIAGAGKNGTELLAKLGNDRVSFFADNNEKIIGHTVMGIRVIPINDLVELKDSNTIIVAIENKMPIIDQLHRLGIDHFVCYASDWRRNQIGKSILEGLSWQEQIINDKLAEYSRQSDLIDPVSNIDLFKQLVIKCKDDKELIEYYKDGCFTFVGRDCESRTYGHLNALFNYADIKDADPKVFPIIPHSPFAFDNFTSYSTATLFSSQFLRDESNKTYAYIPAFVLGEYIQYVPRKRDCSACEDRIKNNSVVVFMHHSIEFIKVEHEYDYLMRVVFEPLLKEYSEVYLSVYWYDLDDELYDLLSNVGIKLVSAGFRFDEKFIYRLAEIIDRSDDVVVFGRTSALIYALARNKRVYYYKESNSKVYYSETNLNSRAEIPEREKHMLLWEGILLNNQGKRFSEYPEKDKKTMDYYFGISTHRTKEEIRLFYDIGREIWVNSDFVEEKYPMAVYKTYWKYQNDYDFKKLALLSEALPVGFWNL